MLLSPSAAGMVTPLPVLSVETPGQGEESLPAPQGMGWQGRAVQHRADSSAGCGSHVSSKLSANCCLNPAKVVASLQTCADPWPG